MNADHRQVTPVRAVTRGIIAGAVGTAAMDTLLFARYCRGGGADGPYEWESSAGVTDWEHAPAPAHVGKRLVEGLFDIKLQPSRARLVNNAMHWAYGALNGAVYGILAESSPRRRVSYGLPFGAAVWVGDYVTLPAVGLYKPIWEYDVKTLADDLSAHLVFGIATAATLRLLSR